MIILAVGLALLSITLLWQHVNRAEIRLAAQERGPTIAIRAPFRFAWRADTIAGWLEASRDQDGFYQVEGIPAGWCVEWVWTTDGLPGAMLKQPGRPCRGVVLVWGTRYVFEKE